MDRWAGDGCGKKILESTSDTRGTYRVWSQFDGFWDPVFLSKIEMSQDCGTAFYLVNCRGFWWSNKPNPQNTRAVSNPSGRFWHYVYIYIYTHGKLYIYTHTDTYKYCIHIIIRPSYLWRYTPIYPIFSWLWRIYRKPSAGFATQVPSQFRPWQVSLRCGWRKLMGCWNLQMVGWTIKHDCTMRNGDLTITSSDLSIKHIDLTSRIRDIASQNYWWYNMGMQWEYSRDTLDELRRPHCDVVGMIVTCRIGVPVQDLSQNGRTFCAGELLQFLELPLNIRKTWT